jgi:signal peptidase II
MTAKELLYDWGGANVWLFQAINLHAFAALDALMEGVSNVGSYWNLPWVAVGWLAIAILLRRANSVMAPQVMRQLQRLLVGTAIAFVLTAGLKLVLDFPRPGAVLAPGAIHVVEAAERDYSLPSGHAAFSALVAVTLWPLLGLPGRLAALLFVLAVGLSRIWLGAHFPADVAAGYLVGLCSGLWAARLTGAYGGSRFFERPQSGDLRTAPVPLAESDGVSAPTETEPGVQ